ncbi:MAG: hypothetical protein BYD32DRAFT_459196 [Podila humilis]|nr:MAG: hypothetical protein BYD32DRAFT_459196 [Podila humilis]
MVHGLQLGGEGLDKKLLIADDDLPYTTPPVYSPQQLPGPDLPSTDPADTDFAELDDAYNSTSNLYFWDYLDGPGRVDSDVQSHWKCGATSVGAELLNAVNFIFLAEAEFSDRGFHGEINDDIWDSLCDALKDPVSPLSNEILTEAHQWSHRLANNKFENLEQLLEESPPNDHTLRSILTKMALSSRRISTSRKLQAIGQDERHGASLFIPDYATTTLVQNHRSSVVLLEDKVASNAVLHQVWDDLTKIGQEMKVALDSILKLLPHDDVCVIGILVREPLEELYTMSIHAEATYIMHGFAAAYIALNAMNMFPIVRLMEVFDHSREIQQTVNQSREVKVEESKCPKVPLSWLWPSFQKSKLFGLILSPNLKVFSMCQSVSMTTTFQRSSHVTTSNF